MCGIAGFFGQRIIPVSSIKKITSALQHRGPDTQHLQGWNQTWEPTGTPCNALIHTRLSIRDLREIADQPMSNSDGDVWICYNGEVYDWEQWLPELESLGYVFHTSSDTEFILHAYQAWGIDKMLSRLRGMFAIAILDLRQQRLFLIRDRIGLKPVLYYHSDGEFAFSSLIRALLPWLPDGHRRLSGEAIDAYLTHRYIPAPLSIIDGVQRLENGCMLEYQLQSRELSKRQYWNPQQKPGEADEILHHSIDIRTVSDRPAGLLLSGGIDSSVIASCLQARDRSRLIAFTARFKGSSMDESEIAERTAKKLKLEHHIVDIPSEIDNDQFSRIVADLDDPFADPSSFPMWYLAEAVSKEIKVVLSGDGGDELFAGYKRYNKHLRSSWRRGITLPGSPFACRGKHAKLWAELRSPWLNSYNLRFSGFSYPQRAGLLSSHPARQVYWRNMEKAASLSKPIDKLLSIDMDNTLAEYILRKGDLCTMAHGLEMRCPLLDHEFYQQVLAMPREQRFTKPAKLALLPFAPQLDELFKLKKRGFNPPLDRWLQSSWKMRYRNLGKRLQQASNKFIDGKAVDSFVKLYLDGEYSLAEQILQLLILDESLQQLIDLGAE
jgi:asparagine synthase (glutamine-hydrolysing)